MYIRDAHKALIAEGADDDRFALFPQGRLLDMAFFQAGLELKTSDTR